MIFPIQFYRGYYSMSLSQCMVCTEAWDISDNLMKGDNEMKHSTSGVYCVLNLFGKAKSWHSPQ